jgi:hypothetical protein
MKTLPEWLDQKYREWEKAQGANQTYYTFARFLDVGHSSLTLWISGASIPSGEDIPRLASKLGPEIYTILNLAAPNSPLDKLIASFGSLPTAFQSRLGGAAAETAQAIAGAKLNPESPDGKRLAVRIFEKWGFKITG